MAESEKEILHRYLRSEREALVGKLDGLSEREVRSPMVNTGTNLLGLVKHAASMELGYFTDVFDRPSGIPTPWLDDDAEDNADMWATADESREQIVAFQQAAAAQVDATIEALDLDAPGRVPWWRPGKQDVTLQQILVHMIAETARHAGHADIIRELVDGRVGLRAGNPNLPSFSTDEWAAYRSRLEQVAESF